MMFFSGIPIFLLCVANISGVPGEMFRFLYVKILCRPCHAIKRRREMERRIKLEEESGINIHCTNTNGWSIGDNTNTNSTKKPTNTFINEINENDKTLRGNQRVTVPLTITMLIIAAYIWIGSAIFNSFAQ